MINELGKLLFGDGDYDETTPVVVRADGTEISLGDVVKFFEAAQQSVHPTCPTCGASLTSGTTPKDGKSHCPSCGASG